MTAGIDDSVNAPQRPRSQWGHLALGIVLTGVLLVWALRGMSPGLVWNALQAAKFEWLGLSAFCLLGSCFVRARRWGTLLRAQGDPGSFDVRQSAVFIGCAGNCLLPVHAGELVRGMVLHRRSGVSLGHGLGSIVVERLLDIIVILIFMLVAFAPRQGTQSVTGGLEGAGLDWVGVVLLAMCGGMFGVIVLSERIVALVETLCRNLKLGRFSSPIVDGVKALLVGLAVLRSPQRACVLLLETVAIVGLSVLTFWAAMFAFEISSPGFSGALLTQSVTTLGMAIPSAPGYVGTFEAAIRFSLELYAVPTDAIIAYALTLHALVFVSLISTGVMMAIRMKMSWADLSKSFSISEMEKSKHQAAA